MLTMTALASFLGVSPIFGALVAGILAGDLRGHAEHARQTIQSYSYAFFIPLYFAVVGLRLDLIHDFEPLFFVVFLLVACLVKSVSTYVAARMTGEGKVGARNLAAALNARGGPGIVLASVAFDAKIIGEAFYTILVMLALVTSVIAGSWLEAVLKRGRGLLTEDQPDRQTRSATA
jgi:Kef-type K+ transport system membrane component KefB